MCLSHALLFLHISKVQKLKKRPNIFQPFPRLLQLIFTWLYRGGNLYEILSAYAAYVVCDLSLVWEVYSKR